MPEVSTIQVYWPKQGKGIFQINESDFDPEIHSRLSDKQEIAAETAAADARVADTDFEELKPKRGNLPDDFPHVEILREAGITTYAKARALKGDYGSIEGIGEARALDIDAGLAD